MAVHKKVLVLDDNAFNRTLLRDVLEDGGYDAETVEDLPAFEKALLWWRPDVLVIDVNMPRHSGIEVAQRVRAEGGPPLILISAMTQSSVDQLAHQCGAEAAYSTLSGMRGLCEVVARLLDPDKPPGRR